ncbi:MAG: hypothetical protein AB1918_11165 [Pseudomonadota bacterium]
MDAERIIDCGRRIARAHALLDRCAEMAWPSEAAVVTCRGLLDEARREVELADAALRH